MSAIAVSLFSDVFATSVRLESMDPEQIAELIRSTTKPLKPQLPLLKLARFGNTAVPHTGSLRHDQNLVACTGVEGDYDGEVVSLEEAAERLLKSNISCIVCTTPSYTIDRPRWRVFAWFSRELPPTDRARMTDRLNGALGGILATESWTLSQSYYYGSINDNPSHRVEIIDGEPIDRIEDLDLIAISKPSGAGPKPNGHDPGGGPFDEPALIAAIISGENYHEPKIRLLGKWAHDGIAFMEAERRLFEAFDAVDGSLRDARWAERRADIPRTVEGIFCKEAEKRDDADIEFNDVQAAIDALQHGDVVSPIIDRIAAAQITATTEGRLLDKIKLRTGLRIGDLRDELQSAKKRIKAKRKGVAAIRDWSVLVKRYAEASDTPGEIRPMMVNVALIIRNTPEFRGAIWYNEFTDLITVRRPLLWDDGDRFKERDWTDYDELKTTEWLQGMDDFINAPPHVVFQGIETVAREQSYHPVRDYLNSLVWDGVSRIDKLLPYYFGCEREDPNYLKAIGAKSLIQAVARINRPGIKADCMLILEGEQGIKKSTGLRMIFDPLDQGWFSDDAGELGTTDSKMKIRGKWGVELGEFAGLTKRGIRQAKAYLSSTDDEYRPPYGRRQKKFARQNVFISSTNDEEVLNDASGGRRFWFAWCSSIDTDALWNDRHQLWAEAVHRYRNGERWHIDNPDIEKAAKAEQAKRQETDAWDDVILDYLKIVKAELFNRSLTAAAYEAAPNVDPKIRAAMIDAANTGVTTSQILTEKLGKRLCDIENRDQQRVGNILRRLGWRRQQIGRGAMRGKTHYLPPLGEEGEDEM